jgi:hypothetical protein
LIIAVGQAATTRMDQSTFTKLIQSLKHSQTNASDVAPLILIPMLLLAVIFGFCLSVWIFRGGLSRRSFPPFRQ